jgi:predicted RNA methylase|eukprot:gene7162-7734_t
MDSEDEETLPFHWLEGDSLAPPCQTDHEIVATIIQSLQPFVNEESCLYDLGCGDGRICLAATNTFHCNSVGIEIESTLVDKFNKKIEKLPPTLQSKVQAKNEDLLAVPFENDANVIVLYLLPEAIELIREKLLKVLERDGVVLCNSWGIKGLQPIQTIECGFANNVKLLLYTKQSLENQIK